MRRFLLVALCSFSVGLFLVTSSPVLSSEYETLRKQIENNQALDTELVKDLPEPSTAEQFWLRSFTRTKVTNALSDLEKALARSSGSASTYIETWLDIALLDEPAADRFSFLQSQLSANRDSIESGVWLKAGKYAGSLKNYSPAIRWAERSLETEETRFNALLDLAEYALESGQPDRANEYLDRYFLKRSGRTHARYWILRGRYFRTVGSDSEAYVAYSHLVREYPDSLVLNRAERTLGQLELPGPFRPETAGTSSFSTTETSTDRSRQKERRGRWVIQLGSFQTRGRARRFRRRMESKLEGSLVVKTVRLNGKQYHRVQMVGYETKRQAQQRQQQLERNGIDSFIMEGSHQ